MPRAAFVPETYHLTGDDVRLILKRIGRGRLLKDSMRRFWAADGGSHSRALAHAAILTFFPGLIAVVGVATAFQLPTFQAALQRTITALTPGPAGRILNEALLQGSKASGAAALVGGIAAAMISGTTAMTQIQRGANRIYGLHEDRPPIRRYGLAFVMNLSAGLLLVAAFALLAGGGTLSSAAHAGGWSHDAYIAFAIGRWPVGVVLATVAITMVLKIAPNRRQPKGSWLVSPTLLSAALWLTFTALLALYFSFDAQLGRTYGPLLGIVGLLLWAYLTAVALYLGFAFAAQLEAVRSGHPQPHQQVRLSFQETQVVPWRTAPPA